jgi:salicyloyl-CoA 5-hydroxylase
VAGQRLEGRVLTVAGGVAELPGGPLPLLPEPADDGAWGLWVDAPDAEADLPAALEAVAKGVAAGAALVAVGGGSPLTRRLLCEEARLTHRAVALLVEEAAPDVALTAVLSGRTDLVGTPAEAAP